ncbi:MAG: phosphoribosyltransferase family protein [Pseudomonadota bacterium]
MTFHPDRDTSGQVARLLLDSGCVQVRAEEPFRLPSGWASPVYMDCRRLISFPAVRRELLVQGLALLKARGCLDGIDAIAGAEASGIAFAAWMADELDRPLVYVRKQTRGLGLGSQMVGAIPPSGRLLLVDDLLAAGTSKANFVRAIHAAGAGVKDIFVIFDYGTFPVDALLDPLKVTVHSLASWPDVLAAARGRGDFDDRALAELEAFLADPARWSAAHGGISQPARPL